ncbi:hypothetical protein SAMN05216275_12739 [Streptosporangium canum]|uniref:Phage integrase family protein n=1 Tax=Streptosporangium canum TaxID=324952 RepID=A0A1I4A416_9ACTN|nr:hypothetical protein [Streptosporangium canum]SFK51075.1 hypothetical protein SAMN05216275_12739 [Streptosporangium canum]
MPKYKVSRGLTVPQSRLVLKAAHEHRLSALYVLAPCLGRRRGELLGLRWVAIDLDDKRNALGKLGDALGRHRPYINEASRRFPSGTLRG